MQDQTLGNSQTVMNKQLPGADAAFDIVWDELGIAHVYAQTIADAYRGMGYAAGSERLWQIHLSCAFANSEAAELLGDRFVNQDAIQRACNVDGRQTSCPASEGDWIVDAYLDGLNAVVLGLEDIPPEFSHANTQPRLFTRADIAARYRFTSWFQHKSWTEKMVLGRLMATHGVDYFKHHILHFSDTDAKLIDLMSTPLQQLETASIRLAYPDAVSTHLSGSNNWAITGAHTQSGKAMLATDPHQPHSIPNTFFYAHLHAGNWDVFGAAFPGVPYFMMGYNRDISWGLTTGFVDCYDIYLEQIEDDRYLFDDQWCDLEARIETIPIKGASSRAIEIKSTANGPLLETLTDQLGLTQSKQRAYQTALYWSLTSVPTSAGALARLPLAKSAKEFGELLFEDDICPLVNNIICVDKANGLRRFIAATLPARSQVTGSVPLPGWDSKFVFGLSTAASLTVEVDPPCGYSLTANNDTMGERGDFYIHNFPTHNARADRIEDLLCADQKYSTADFKAMQLDLTDLHAAEVLPDLVKILSNSKDPDIQKAVDILANWDYKATVDSIAACLYYPFMDQFWPRNFMHKVLGDNLLKVLPVGAPGLNRFDIKQFTMPDSPWLAHADIMQVEIADTMKSVVQALQTSLGSNPQDWRWGDLHQISFQHSLAKHPTWSHMQVGPDPIGGSPTTLAMAMHMGPGPGKQTGDTQEIGCRVYHGPAFRLIIDLADPEHTQFVIAGGNGGNPDSPYITNHYQQWLKGEYSVVTFNRDELNIDVVWSMSP
jgi:penicillin G amidase